jgi:uncharacterized iron-regulated membrane protein
MTGLEIILLCILMVVSTASGVVIWKQRLAYNALEQQTQTVLAALIQKLRYLEMLIQEYQLEDEDSWETLH